MEEQQVELIEQTCGLSVVNFLLSPEVLEKKIGKKPTLINPLKYYEKQRLSL